MKKVKKQLALFAIVLMSSSALAQNIYTVKFDDCHTTKFSFCLDCGESKARFESDIEAYFKNEYSDLSAKTNGKLQVQVIVDSAGNQCVKSLQSEANINYKKLKIKDKINAMKGWKPALEKGKPKNSSISLEFSFKDGSVAVHYLRFDPAGTTNMKSVGEVSIKNKNKFKNSLDDSQFNIFTTSNSSIPWDISRAISIDAKNVIWFGTDNGLVKITTEKTEILNHKNSKLKATRYDARKTASIMASDVDRDNNKWFSDGFTVYKYNEKDWQVFDSINSPIKWATGIYASKNGNIYFEGFYGLDIFNGKDWSTLTMNNSKLPSDRVMGIFVDSKNRQWIGTDKGNIRIDGTTVEDFTKTDNPLKTATLTKGFEDKSGNIWFSLYEKYPQTKGLAKYSNDGNWTVITAENATIPNNNVLDFAIDEEHNVLWISLNEVGLCRFDGKDWTTMTPENSKVPSTYIQDITLDKFGNLWCATFAGLLRIDYK